MTIAVAPAPPPDAALPALAVALGPDAGALTEALVRPGYELVGCRPCYLRYKPQQSCIVLYRLWLRSDGREVERLVHARLYADDRARRIWSREPIHALAEQVDRKQPTSPLRAAAYVPSLGALLQAYPVDLELPPLARLGTVQPVRYKPARKALLHQDGRFVKVYADDRGARAFAAGHALARAGVPVVEPLVYRPESRALTHPAEVGTPLSALRGQRRYADAAREAGAALARLHDTPVDGLALHSWREELAAAAWAVGVARPDLEADAQRLARRLARLLETAAREPVTAHGDFYDEQVLVGPRGPLVLDLDRIARADPLLDLGTFLAHLRIAGDEGDDILAGYAQPSAAVEVAEAAALLKLSVAPFRALTPDWPEEVERRLGLAQELIRAGAGRRLRDPALPQLAELLDPRAASRVLERLLDRPVEVRAVEVIRHRPARRATLRFELGDGCLYGKTFASDRAARVFRTVHALTEAGVPAPDPVGLDERRHLVVQREVVGEPAVSRLLGGDVALAAGIARAASALHASRAKLERAHTLDDELRIVHGRLSELPPRLEAEARARLEAASAVARACSWRLRPIHRDLYPEQVVVDGDRVVFLDVDDAALSEPAVDVANFLAHLRLLALQHREREEAVAATARVFAAGFAEFDPRLLDALETLTLIRLACIHLPRGGTELAEQLITTAEVQWP